MNLRVLGILAAALLTAVLGLIASIRINGPGPLLGTAAGRWLVEQVGADHAPAGVVPLRVGEAIGGLSLTDLDGHPQQLPLSGRQRVLINLWATWCGPCREEMPLLVKFAADQGVNGVQVVGIAQDESAAVRAYLRRTPVNYPILLDDPSGRAGGRLGDTMGVLPYSVLLDGDGRLLAQHYGPFADAKALSAWVSKPE